MNDTPIRMRLREQVTLRGTASPFGELAHLALQEIDRQRAEIVDLRGGLERSNIKLRELTGADTRTGFRILDLEQQIAELMGALKQTLDMVARGVPDLDTVIRGRAALSKVGAGGTATLGHNAKAVGLDAAGGQSHTSDGLCVAVDTENRT